MKKKDFIKYNIPNSELFDLLLEFKNEGLINNEQKKRLKGNIIIF